MGNGQISNWGIATVDTIAERKRVVFRPATAADTIRVGDLVCYNSDLVGDWKEATTNRLISDFGGGDGTVYAEGSQTYNARLLVVEQPATANLQFFAGVVAALGPEAGADGDTIEIYVPNGAVVPVMCDQNCILDRTIVAVRNGVYEGSYPSSTARPIGVAMETVDRSGTDGLVWVKVDPNMFIWQYHASLLAVDDEGTTSNHIVNKINITSAQTGGRFTAFEIIGTSTGGATSSATGLALYAEANVTGTVANHVAGSGIKLSITGGTPTEYLTALEVTLYEDGATMTSAGRTSVLSLSMQVADALSANLLGWIWMAQNGAQAADAFILSSNLAALPAVQFTGDVSLNGQYGIKVYLANNPDKQWYIPLVNVLTD